MTAPQQPSTLRGQLVVSFTLESEEKLMQYVRDRCARVPEWGHKPEDFDSIESAVDAVFFCPDPPLDAGMELLGSDVMWLKPYDQIFTRVSTAKQFQGAHRQADIVAKVRAAADAHRQQAETIAKFMAAAGVDPSTQVGKLVLTILIAMDEFRKGDGADAEAEPKWARCAHCAAINPQGLVVNDVVRSRCCDAPIVMMTNAEARAARAAGNKPPTGAEFVKPIPENVVRDLERELTPEQVEKAVEKGTLGGD